MRFGAVPLDQALGAILAHSQSLSSGKLPKGHVLTKIDLTNLEKNGFSFITVARLDHSDIEENSAAALLAQPLNTKHVRVTEPFSGRVNLIAQTDGVFRVNAKNISEFNSVNEAITLATLPDYARVHQGTLLGTIKIIPYAANGSDVKQALGFLAQETLSLHPFVAKTADLILTQTQGFKPSLLKKGKDVIQKRLLSLGVQLKSVQIVAHTSADISSALNTMSSDMGLILGASATSDRADEAPAALMSCGGIITRFGMPVDPGNLLFLGELNKIPVIGLPGCVRSPALNGADWVLERIAAGLPVTHADIAIMGVGGLLKEVPARPQPRRAGPIQKGKPHILLLAAGRSSRMRGENKLLRKIDGVPLLTRTIRELGKSNAAAVTVTLDPKNDILIELAKAENAEIAQVPDAKTGLSASLRAGIDALPRDATAVIIALADMPDVTADDLNALIAAHDPQNGVFICAPIAPNGKRGNPVLFDRRYFESLSTLAGDVGAKALIDAETDCLVTVKRGQGVLTDLDTPEAWDDWNAARQAI